MQIARQVPALVGLATHPLRRPHTEGPRPPRIPPNRLSWSAPTRCAACIPSRQSMKTLHLTLVAALVAGCHFDKLFNSAPGGSHAPPPGSGSIRLAFTAQPTDAMKDSIIKPPVQVTVFDSVGSVVTSFAGDVTLAIGNDPGVLKARLSGRSQAAASAGVATFGDLSINQLGNGYTLIATIEAGTIPKESASFNITAVPSPAPGAGTPLASTQQPHAAPASAASSHRHAATLCTGCL